MTTHYISPSPIAPTKGTPLSVDLVKADLLNDASFQLAADNYFKNTLNWKSVEITMTSTGGQSETMIFDCDNLDATVTTDFLISDSARNVWKVTKVIVFDFDGGRIRLSTKDGQLVESDFNFDLTPVIEEYVEIASTATQAWISNTGVGFFKFAGQQFTHTGTGTYTSSRIEARFAVQGSPTHLFDFHLAPDTDRGNPILSIIGLNAADVVDNTYHSFDISSTVLTDGVKYFWYIIAHNPDHSGGVMDGSNRLGLMGEQSSGNSYRNTNYAFTVENGQYANGFADIIGASMTVAGDWDFKVYGEED